MKKVVCFGEVLWDVFPDYKNIGGAPLNVAFRLNNFGVDVNIVSRIGDDENGKDLIEYLNNVGIHTKYIQVDQEFKTGVVNITLDKKGSASYEIEYPVAWDKINIDSEIISLVKSCDTFIFGSLACRDHVSENTLMKLLNYASFKVFDVNLRQPHYSMGLIFELMLKSDMIKFNDEELLEVCDFLYFKSDKIEEQIRFISQKTKTKIICVTRGAKGAILFKEGEFYKGKTFQIKVEDTVGAGDSFLASLIFKILQNSKPNDALNFASATGAIVASKKGANPALTFLEIEKFHSHIKK